MDIFTKEDLKDLIVGEASDLDKDTKSVCVIGGSSLFHGAPLLALKVVSRNCGEVFFATPEKSVGYIAEQIKSKLMSFIWIPWNEVDKYIKKSEVVLIGPGFMRFQNEEGDLNSNRLDTVGQTTKKITEDLITKFPDKKWVIDAGSLQVVDKEKIPSGSILTPNKNEYRLLFGQDDPNLISKKYNCTLVLKGEVDRIYSPSKSVEVKGGNIGMAKGGTGDVLAGIVASLFCKNNAFMSAAAASLINKMAGDELFKSKGMYFNADDLADKLPETMKSLLVFSATSAVY